jgi:hypothetical protein
MAAKRRPACALGDLVTIVYCVDIRRLRRD